MVLICERHLWCFEFWAGAKDFREQLTPEELDIIEEQLDVTYATSLT